MIAKDLERVFIGVGSNLGDREANIAAAIGLLEENPHIAVDAIAGLYETDPVGLIEQPDFLNSVIELRTTLDPKRLLICLKQIERDLGRKVRDRWGPREIDLDILLMGNRVVDKPDLQIPHSQMHHRAFVLVPLAELAADFTHPGLGCSIRDLLAGLKDERGVEPYLRIATRRDRDLNPMQSPDLDPEQSGSHVSLKKRF